MEPHVAGAGVGAAAMRCAAAAWSARAATSSGDLLLSSAAIARSASPDMPGGAPAARAAASSCSCAHAGSKICPGSAVRIDGEAIMVSTRLLSTAPRKLPMAAVCQ